LFVAKKNGRFETMEKTALVTGGSRGIGLAIVHKFLAEGFDVISVSRTEGALAELKEKFSGKLHILTADFSDVNEVLATAAQVRSMISKLDVLVNNAGIFLPGQVHTEEDGVYEQLMALNVSAPYHFTRAILPVMMPHKQGYVFNLCSTASVVPYVNGGSYCISKHALLGFSKVLRQELMSFGIGVSAIMPGATLTDSWGGTDFPESRFIKPSNIAECIWYAWQNRENSVMEEIILRPVKGDL
jgi:short-subunit dehydrogenase